MSLNVAPYYQGPTSSTICSWWRIIIYFWKCLFNISTFHISLQFSSWQKLFDSRVMMEAAKVKKEILTLNMFDIFPSLGETRPEGGSSGCWRGWGGGWSGTRLSLVSKQSRQLCRLILSPCRGAGVDDGGTGMLGNKLDHETAKNKIRRHFCFCRSSSCFFLMFCDLTFEERAVALVAPSEIRDQSKSPLLIAVVTLIHSLALYSPLLHYMALNRTL